MKQFPIGVLLESFRLPPDRAIQAAADLGIKGLQLYATRGPFSPDEMTPARQKELQNLLDGHGMVISALCGDLGHGFIDTSRNPKLIEESKKIMYLARELGVNVVTTHIGAIPQDKSEDQYKIMQDACFQLAEYAHALEAFFAVETGPEPSAALAEFLDSLSVPGVAVNMDPANLMIFWKEDAVQAVRNLGRYIVHTHAKDGRQICPLSADEVRRAYTNIDDFMALKDRFCELPLGQGDVDFPAYLAALEEAGYNGYLTIEREVGETPGRILLLRRGICGG
ncbi:MAG: sugar phosphate isomerase/epimerase [Clostridia bacterium]|nr:sugar phosphate isomerase/epimerase [Clostridia bacterium]